MHPRARKFLEQPREGLSCSLLIFVKVEPFTFYISSFGHVL